MPAAFPIPSAFASTAALVLGIAAYVLAFYGFEPFAPTVFLASGFDIRVAKGFGTRAYNQTRISVVSTHASPPLAGFFDYSGRFAHKWTEFFLHSALREAAPGETTRFSVGVDEVAVRLPRQGSGVVGVFIADPCVHSPTGKQWLPCRFGDSFQTITTIPALINAFVGDGDMDFWGILGDNFYDRTGEITWDFFTRISIEAKSKIFITVPGNHDYWVYGVPELSTTADQCGYGHMQYFAQDTKAGVMMEAEGTPSPFNFSVDPGKGRFLSLGCNLPAMENAFWYSQIGNVGFVGQSGAYPLAEARPFMLEACAWLGSQPGLELAVLLGHWDAVDFGAWSDMAMPPWFAKMSGLPGCDAFHRRGALKFITGHTHCNAPYPGSHGTGFRVAGFGMDGCGDYGVPVLDTTDRRVRLWYFDTSSGARYADVLGCVRARGWRRCTGMAALWLDQPIGDESPAEHAA